MKLRLRFEWNLFANNVLGCGFIRFRRFQGKIWERDGVAGALEWRIVGVGCQHQKIIDFDITLKYR